MDPLFGHRIVRCLLSQAFIFGLAFAHAAFGFGVPRISGGRFASPESGRPLQTVLAIPENQNFKRVFILVHGDAEGCSSFPVVQERLIATALSYNTVWVIPETAKQATCRSGGYRNLDFDHRVAEILRLLSTLRQDPRFSHSDLYLAGHSAGGDIVARVAALLPYEIRGLVILSRGGSTLEHWEEAFGPDPDESRQRLLGWQKAGCLGSRVSWKDRSDAFWCQFMNSSIERDLDQLSQHMPILFFHGDSDRTVPVQASKEAFAQLKALGRDVDLHVFRGARHSYWEKSLDIRREIDRWLRRHGPAEFKMCF